MSEQDGVESTGSRTPSLRSRDRQRIEDLEELVLRSEAQMRDLLARFDPRPARASDVGGFATPAEGSVGDPSEEIPAVRPTSPTAAEAAIARHTVGFVPPPPSGVPPPIPVGPAVAPFPARPSRLELPITDNDASSTASSDPIPLDPPRVGKALSGYPSRFSVAP